MGARLQQPPDSESVSETYQCHLEVCWQLLSWCWHCSSACFGHSPVLWISSFDQCGLWLGRFGFSFVTPEPQNSSWCPLSRDAVKVFISTPERPPM